MPPEIANAISFARGRRQRHRLGRTFVVADRDDRAPDARSPDLREDGEAHGEEEQAQVVVGVPRREVDDPGVGPLEHRDRPGELVDAEPAAGHEPVLHEHRERQGGDREVQARDAQRGDADQHRGPRAHEHTEGHRHTPRDVVHAEPARRHHLHGDETADGREPELAERELTGPSAEDRERAAGDGEDHAPGSRGTTATPGARMPGSPRTRAARRRHRGAAAGASTRCRAVARGAA